MTKNELRKEIENGIRWQIKWCDDAIKDGFQWALDGHCDKIQGMLLIAMYTNLISHDEWHCCMSTVNALKCMGMNKKLIYNLEYPD